MTFLIGSEHFAKEKLKPTVLLLIPMDGLHTRNGPVETPVRIGLVHVPIPVIDVTYPNAILGTMVGETVAPKLPSAIFTVKFLPGVITYLFL